MWEKSWISTAVDNFNHRYERYKAKYSDSSAHDQVSNSEPIDDFAKYCAEIRGSSRPQTETGPAFNERSAYFDSPLVQPGTDVFKYWKNNEYQFPILAKMARDYLIIQASSVPAERAFSSGTDLVTANRCSMTGKTIEITQFLKMRI